MRTSCRNCVSSKRGSCGNKSTGSNEISGSKTMFATSQSARNAQLLWAFVRNRPDVVSSGPWCLSETGRLETSLSRAQQTKNTKIVSPPLLPSREAISMRTSCRNCVSSNHGAVGTRARVQTKFLSGSKTMFATSQSARNAQLLWAFVRMLLAQHHCVLSETWASRNNFVTCAAGWDEATPDQKPLRREQWTSEWA